MLNVDFLLFHSCKGHQEVRGEKGEGVKMDGWTRKSDPYILMFSVPDDITSGE